MAQKVESFGKQKKFNAASQNFYTRNHVVQPKSSGNYVKIIFNG